MTGKTEIPDRWIKQFKTRLDADPAAQSTWKKIEAAGLEDGALFLLWGFAGGARRELDQMHRRAEDASDRLRAAQRAEEIARTKTPKRAHDSDLFRRRAKAARKSTISSAWPMPTPDTLTLGDELARVEAETRAQPTLAAVGTALAKAAGKRSRVNDFYILFLLQSYLDNHGVRLGYKRIVRLASLVDPDPDAGLDEGTLGRYFRSIPQPLKDRILRDTLPTLPPPTSKRR